MPLSSTVNVLARGRQTLLRRANEILSVDKPETVAGREDTVPALAGLLASALEELKGVEEDLRAQNAALVERRAADEGRIEYYRRLFQHIPSPAIITDLNASILEANREAMQLFRRDASLIERRPLASLVDDMSRDAFRRQLAHVVATRDTRTCSLVLHRTGDVPLQTHATVSLVPELGPTSSGILFWLFDRSTTSM